MGKFLERHRLPKVTQEVENLYRSMTSKKIELAIKNLPMWKTTKRC